MAGEVIAMELYPIPKRIINWLMQAPTGEKLFLRLVASTWGIFELAVFTGIFLSYIITDYVWWISFIIGSIWAIYNIIAIMLWFRIHKYITANLRRIRKRNK